MDRLSCISNVQPASLGSHKKFVLKGVAAICEKKRARHSLAVATGTSALLPITLCRCQLLFWRARTVVSASICIHGKTQGELTISSQEVKLQFLIHLSQIIGSLKQQCKLHVQFVISKLRCSFFYVIQTRVKTTRWHSSLPPPIRGGSEPRIASACRI